MSPDKKPKYKILTRQDWDKSKPKSFTPTTYSRTIRKIIDLNTWGWIDPKHGYTKKKHLFSSDAVNEALRGTRILLNKRNGKGRTNIYRFYYTIKTVASGGSYHRS